MHKDREPAAESSFTTRRAALGVTAAMTAGLLAEKALSPDSAHAEGVTSVDGKTGAVTGVLTGLVAAPSTASTEAEKATANTTAIQNAINTTEGPIYLQKGVYIVNKLTLKAGTRLIGAGIEGTVLKLKAGVKDNLLESEGFLKLTEEYEKGEHTNKAFGPAHISVANLTLDGNKANNASPETYKGACIALNACSWIVENVHCRNAGASGFVSYCSEEALATEKTEGSYESVVRGVTCYFNTNSGFVFEGPSSSRISDLHCFSNGSGSAGIKACGTTSYWTNCRSWGFQKWRGKYRAPSTWSTARRKKA